MLQWYVLGSSKDLISDSCLSQESPFPHRVRLALEEAQVPYDIISVSLLSDKPEWFGKNVYPEAKVVHVSGPVRTSTDYQFSRSRTLSMAVLS